MPAIALGQSETPLVLSIDIGTSSVRVIVFDRLGRPLEGLDARRTHDLRTTIEGASEADPDLLLDRVWKCIDRVLARARRQSWEISAVAVCTFVGNIVGLDETGQAITPLVTYADSRASAEVPGLKADFDETEVHDRTGCPFHPSYWPAFLRWMSRESSDLFKSAKRWVTLGAYLESKLFGEGTTSYSAASWTGLLNRRTLTWDESLLAGLPVSAERLSSLTDASVPRCGLLPEFAPRWPALRNVPWFPAIGDGAAANIGSGCVSSERIALTVGTTTALRAVVETPVESVPEGLWCYRVDSKRSLPGGALNEGGSVYAWMNKTLRLAGSSKTEGFLAASEPDRHGLTVLPFFAGERSPGWAGHARAAIVGLSLSTTPEEILQAGIEAVAYRIKFIFESLRPLLPGRPEVIAGGGAMIHSPAWIRIITDVLGRSVSVSRIKEPSARGAALLALESLGALKDLMEAPDFLGPMCDPDPGRHERYSQALQRQKRLYDILIGPTEIFSKE
jgi:gluconokinase